MLSPAWLLLMRRVEVSINADDERGTIRLVAIAAVVKIK